MLVSGSVDHTVKLWAHAPSSKGGRQAYTSVKPGDGASVRPSDAARRKKMGGDFLERQTLEGHRNAVTCLVGYQGLVISGGADGHVVVWTEQSGRQGEVFEQPFYQASQTLSLPPVESQTVRAAGTRKSYSVFVSGSVAGAVAKPWVSALQPLCRTQHMDTAPSLLVGDSAGRIVSFDSVPSQQGVRYGKGVPFQGTHTLSVSGLAYFAKDNLVLSAGLDGFFKATQASQRQAVAAGVDAASVGYAETKNARAREFRSLSAVPHLSQVVLTDSAGYITVLDHAVGATVVDIHVADILPTFAPQQDYNPDDDDDSKDLASCLSTLRLAKQRGARLRAVMEGKESMDKGKRGSKSPQAKQPKPLKLGAKPVQPTDNEASVSGIKDAFFLEGQDRLALVQERSIHTVDIIFMAEGSSLTRHSGPVLGAVLIPASVLLADKSHSDDLASIKAQVGKAVFVGKGRSDTKSTTFKSTLIRHRQTPDPLGGVTIADTTLPSLIRSGRAVGRAGSLREATLALREERERALGSLPSSACLSMYDTTPTHHRVPTGSALAALAAQAGEAPLGAQGSLPPLTPTRRTKDGPTPNSPYLQSGNSGRRSGRGSGRSTHRSGVGFSTPQPTRQRERESRGRSTGRASVAGTGSGWGRVSTLAGEIQASRGSSVITDESCYSALRRRRVGQKKGGRLDISRAASLVQTKTHHSSHYTDQTKQEGPEGSMLYFVVTASTKPGYILWQPEKCSQPVQVVQPSHQELLRASVVDVMAGSEQTDRFGVIQTAGSETESSIRRKQRLANRSVVAMGTEKKGARQQVQPTSGSYFEGGGDTGSRAFFRDQDVSYKCLTDAVDAGSGSLEVKRMSSLHEVSVFMVHAPLEVSIVGHEDGVISISSLKSGSLTIYRNVHTSFISSIVLCPVTKKPGFVCATFDGSMSSWSLGTAPLSGRVTATCVSTHRLQDPEGADASLSPYLNIALQDPEGADAVITCMTYCDAAGTLLVGTQSGAVHVVAVNRMSADAVAVAVTHPHPVTSVHCLGQTVASADEGGNVWLWELDGADIEVKEISVGSAVHVLRLLTSTDPREAKREKEREREREAALHAESPSLATSLSSDTLGHRALAARTYIVDSTVPQLQARRVMRHLSDGSKADAGPSYATGSGTTRRILSSYEAETLAVGVGEFLYVYSLPSMRLTRHNLPARPKTLGHWLDLYGHDLLGSTEDTPPESLRHCLWVGLECGTVQMVPLPEPEARRERVPVTMDSEEEGEERVCTISDIGASLQMPSPTAAK
ncbi:LOW QUALITY PROTEIN: hypothetical protein KIPB_004404 [Kipferlia bialata]|uniref:Uncharacterized protein n=1 Tax=Kipferlia bialata TaxID=797122 RepID=A0A9K3CV15_9EUKA|nr:LOW QUALITY PROTEIN: hypothetical protein KIPB_004404 [Kipferlia bialata]